MSILDFFRRDKATEGFSKETHTVYPFINLIALPNGKTQWHAQVLDYNTSEVVKDAWGEVGSRERARQIAISRVNSFLTKHRKQ